MNDIVKNPEEKDELYEHFRFEVTAGTEMLRIDKYLFNLIANTSRNKVQQAAKADCILVNGKPVKQNTPSLLSDLKSNMSLLLSKECSDIGRRDCEVCKR